MKRFFSFILCVFHVYNKQDSSSDDICSKENYNKLYIRNQKIYQMLTKLQSKSEIIPKDINIIFDNPRKPQITRSGLKKDITKNEFGFNSEHFTKEKNTKFDRDSETSLIEEESSYSYDEEKRFGDDEDSFVSCNSTAKRTGKRKTIDIKR